MGSRLPQGRQGKRVAQKGGNDVWQVRLLLIVTSLMDGMGSTMYCNTHVTAIMSLAVCVTPSDSTIGAVVSLLSSTPRAQMPAKLKIHIFLWVTRENTHLPNSPVALSYSTQLQSRTCYIWGAVCHGTQPQAHSKIDKWPTWKPHTHSMVQGREQFT